MNQDIPFLKIKEIGSTGLIAVCRAEEPYQVLSMFDDDFDGAFDFVRSSYKDFILTIDVDLQPIEVIRYAGGKEVERVVQK